MRKCIQKLIMLLLMVYQSYIDDRKAVIGSYHFVFEDENCTVPEDKAEEFDNLSEQYSRLYLAIQG